MWSVDHETVPAVVSPKPLVILAVDLPVTGLSVGVFVHRALDFDRRAVTKSSVVPARPLEIEPTLLGHPFLDGRAEVVGSFRAVHAHHARRAPIYIYSSAGPTPRAHRSLGSRQGASAVGGGLHYV